MPVEKETIKIEIEDLEDEPTADEQPSSSEETAHQAEKVDLSEELRLLGRQFAETVQTAWNSEERKQLENDFRVGMKNFAEEVNKTLEEVRQSESTRKVQQKASKASQSETAQKAKGSVAAGLHWLSGELSKLSQRLTPADENTAAEDTADTADEKPSNS